MAVIAIGVSMPRSAQAKAETYPVTPFAEVDGEVTGSIGGQELKFERHHTYHPAQSVHMFTTRARFAIDSAMPVELTVPSSLQNPVLHGVGRTLPIQKNGNTLSFTIPAPGHYYIEAQGIDRKILLWADDLRVARVQPGQPNVIDVTTRGITSDGGKNQTAAIQYLIDTVPDGSTIYFPAGVYRTGTIRIGRNNLTLYFDRGSLLKGTDAVGDYRQKAFVVVEQASNITIAGPGTIDANGMKTWARMKWEDDDEVKIRNLEIMHVNNITVKDVLLMDSNSWSLHFEMTNGVRIENVKIFGGKDGIDPDNSSNIVIDTVYVQSVDDALAFKTVERNLPLGNIRVRNCLLSSGRATGLKFGTENYSDIDGVYIEQCDIIESDRGVSFYLRKSDQAVRNVTFKNLRVRSTRDALKNDPVEAGKDAVIENVRYENLVLELNDVGKITDGYFNMRGIYFTNLQVHVNPPQGDKLFLIDPASNPSIEGMEVFWRGHRGGWNGLFRSPREPQPSGLVEHDGWGQFREFPPLTPDLPPAPDPQSCKINAQVACAREGTSATVSYQFTEEPNYTFNDFMIRINAFPDNAAECESEHLPGTFVDWYCGKTEGRGEDRFETAPRAVFSKQFAVTPGVPYRLAVGGDYLPSGEKIDRNACSSQLVDFTCQGPAQPEQTPVQLFTSLISRFGQTNCPLNKIGDCRIDIFDYNARLQEL